jgi:hypothetical protein
MPLEGELWLSSSWVSGHVGWFENVLQLLGFGGVAAGVPT